MPLLAIPTPLLRQPHLQISLDAGPLSVVPSVATTVPRCGYRAPLTPLQCPPLHPRPPLLRPLPLDTARIQEKQGVPFNVPVSLVFRHPCHFHGGPGV